MYSGFYCNKRFLHRSYSWGIVAAAVVLAAVFFVFAPPVMADGDGSKPTVYAVNLRENDWVYSVYETKDKARFASVTRYDGDEIDIVIPSELGKVPVREISREAFYNNKYLTSVVIPDGVEKIGRYSFGGCIGLSRVAFPSSLTGVADGAFYGCRSLTAVELPEGTTSVGSFAFYNCRHLKTVTFPSTLSSIGNSAFGNCVMLEGLALGDGVQKIGDMAFSGCASVTSAELTGVRSLGFGAFINCTSLKKAALGDRLTEIRRETFRGCEALTGVTVGGGLTTVGASAFEGCQSLRSLPKTDSLKEIGSLAFLDCASLKKTEIGSETDRIGEGAFRGCVSLAKITVSEENESFRSAGGCLYTGDGKTLLLCPQGFSGELKTAGSTQAVERCAAAGCVNMTGAVLSDSLAEIGAGAFFNCPDITALSVPDSVETIGNAAAGLYISGSGVHKEEYLRVYAAEGSVAEKYCADREIPFSAYAGTLLAGSERVVIAEGETFPLTCGFLSRRSADVSWESSDESVATVKKGKITGIAEGSAEITLAAEGFESRVIRVIVTEKKSEEPEREKTYDTRLLYCGESAELSSLFSQLIDPIFSANRFWFSSAPVVASVEDDGTVQAHTPGTAAVTCHMPDGSENIVTVTVTQKPGELTLTQPEEELTVGETRQLEKRMVPSVSGDVITWKSDDESVATVDEQGRITARGQGKCTVTAASASGLKSSVTVRCVIPAESLSLDLETRDVYQGKEFDLTASVTPENSRQKVKWRSSDPAVASVNSKGRVTARTFGSAVIYAETAGGLSAECRVNVVVKAEHLSLDVKKLKINRDSVYKLNAIVRPSYSPETTDRCTWNSTNESVATVDENGAVTAVGAGSCIINCRTGGDLISKCQVQVRLPASSVSIAAEKDSIYIGEVISLEAAAEPGDTTDSVEWTTDSAEIARVSTGGTVKGRSMGTAVITVTLTNDVTGETVSDSVEIKVLKKAESVRLSKSSLSLLAGKNDFISYTVDPDDCNDTVKWYSTDESVASVREDGLITAVSPGTCHIVIETGSGVRDECKVSVR